MSTLEEERYAKLRQHLTQMSPDEIATERAKLDKPERIFELVRDGDALAVAQAVKDGKDMTITDDQGRTPLHYAAAYDARLIARTLVETPDGASWMRDREGRMPLNLAIEAGNREVTRALRPLVFPDIDRGEQFAPLPQELLDRHEETQRELGGIDSRGPEMRDFEASDFLSSRSKDREQAKDQERDR